MSDVQVPGEVPAPLDQRSGLTHDYRLSSPEDARVTAARHAVTDPVEREMAESRGVDLDIVTGLLAAYDDRGRCGGVMPRLLDGAPTFCCLPHGHGGWHIGDDGAEWGEADDRG